MIGGGKGIYVNSSSHIRKFSENVLNVVTGFVPVEREKVTGIIITIIIITYNIYLIK